MRRLDGNYVLVALGVLTILVILALAFAGCAARSPDYPSRDDDYALRTTMARDTTGAPWVVVTLVRTQGDDPVLAALDDTLRWIQYPAHLKPDSVSVLLRMRGDRLEKQAAEADSIARYERLLERLYRDRYEDTQK